MNTKSQTIRTIPLLIVMVLINGCYSFDTSNEHPVTRISVDSLIKTSQSWDSTELPSYPEGKPEITILRITIPPRTKLPLHKHPVINAGVLLKGSLTVTTEENEVLHLRSGDSIVEVVDKWHYGENKNNNPAEIIVFYAGVKGKPITMKRTK